MIKMKHIWALFYLIPMLIVAQEKQAEEAKAFFWGTNDNYKNAVDFPEKWNKESTVILYKNENYDFHKFGLKVTLTKSLRKRIKLLDNAAVEAYSDFSYKKYFKNSNGYKNKNTSVVGVKVVKANGKEEILNIDEEAVKVDNEYKIAIPNLEVGDIVDYYLYTVETFLANAEKFEPDESTIAEEYPIVDYKLFFKTENDFFLTFQTFNGAPKLKEIQTEKRNNRQYVLEASDIEKFKFPRWTYPMVQMPCYKYQVVFARKSKFEDQAYAFLPPKEDVVKQSVDKPEVLDMYKPRFRPVGDVKFLKKSFKDSVFNSKADRITAYYYFMRHYYLTRFIEAYYASEHTIYSNAMYLYGMATYYEKSLKLFGAFAAICEDEDVDYELIIAQKKYDGPIEELLFTENVNLAMKIKTDPPIYIDGFGPNSDIKQISPYVEGTKTYKLERGFIKNDSLYISKYTDNVSTNLINVTLNDTFDGFNVNQTSKFVGHEKTNEQENLMFFDFVYEDYKRYGTESLTDLIKNKKEKDRVHKEMDALIADLKKQREEYLNKRLKESLGIEKIDDYVFTVDNTGRFGVGQHFVYNEKFTVKNNFVKKAGPNYIVELGKLIGGQIHIEEEDRERTLDVYMNFPKTLVYEINFTIPDGYKVQGLENFVKNIDNQTGSFKSTVEVNGNILKIKATKIYKNNYEPVANWPLMLTFLDTAYQFTNEKILLTK